MHTFIKVDESQLYDTIWRYICTGPTLAMQYFTNSFSHDEATL